MKILEIIPTLGPGGGQSLVVDLCNELAKTENVVLVTLRDDTQKYYGFMSKDLESSVNHFSLCLPETSNWLTMWGIYKIIKKEKPNIVHFHMCITYSLLAVLLLGWRYKIVQTIHNDIKTSYSSVKCRFIISITGWLRLNRFVTICKTNYNDFKKIYPGIENTLIFNGRKPLKKTELFQSVQQEIITMKPSPNTKVYLHVARCNPQKNQRLLIEGFNEFIKQGYDAILIVIGFRNEYPEEEILKNIACDRIFFLGTKSNVADYIYNSDCFILSSAYEGMPITVIEALNCGIPVVSTPVSGVIDVINSGKNGYISKDFSKIEFVRAIKQSYLTMHEINETTRVNITNNPCSIIDCAEKYKTLFRKISHYHENRLLFSIL